MIVHDTFQQKETCSGCMACAKECPSKCINHITDSEGFIYPKVDTDICINCDLCVDICPFTHADRHKANTIACYAAWSSNESVRFKSATAGVFTELAKSFIASGGVVYGAAYDDEMTVRHIRAENLSELDRLQGSKYAQSDFSQIYAQIQDDLNDDRQILVCSTPCQIAGIGAAFDCTDITLIDILCLGVPSPLVFDKYIKSTEKKYKKKIKEVNFRDKATGWKTYSQTIVFEDDSHLSCKNNDSSYMRGFLDKIYIRPSCAKCPFSDSSRVGDITIGDYWGIENSHIELDSENGVSVVYVSTDKGAKLLDGCDSITKQRVEKKDTLQQSLIKPATPSTKRAAFFSDLALMNFAQLEKKYMKQRSKIVQFAINMLKY